MADVPTYSTDQVRCLTCSSLIWKVERDCEPCELIQQIKCRSCGSLLQVRFGRLVEVVALNTRHPAWAPRPSVQPRRTT